MKVHIVQTVSRNLLPRASWSIALVILLALVFSPIKSSAMLLPVPNASFESPALPFEPPYAAPFLDFWFNPDNSQFVTGNFLNISQPPLANGDGLQAAFFFADPDVTLFQDFTISGSAFTNTFRVGKSYRLVSGFVGGDEGGTGFPLMKPGASIQMSLYYRDASNNIVTVAATNIIFTTALFPSPDAFVDCEAELAPVQSTDAWAGQHIGIQFLSTITDTNLEGGFWDIDNVRLSELPDITNPGLTNGQFSFTLLSYPGLAFDIIATTNAALDHNKWTTVGSVTNVTGSVSFTDTNALATQRFYQARQSL